jgi:hypothetical protein
MYQMDYEQGINHFYVLARGAARVTTFGPPLALLVAVGAIFLAVLIRRGPPDQLREWWAGLSGRLLLLAVVWLGINLVALYGTALVHRAGAVLRTVLASGWLATVVAGVIAAQGRATDSPATGRSPVAVLARITPAVFIAGLLIGLSLLLHDVLDNPPNWLAADPDALPVVSDPILPSTRVTQRTVINEKMGQENESPQVEEKEQRRVTDEAEAYNRAYWIGLVMTTPNTVPTVWYILEPDAWTDSALKEAGVPDWVRDRLDKRQLRHTFHTREELRYELAQALRHPEARPYRLKVLRAAQRIGLRDPQKDSAVTGDEADPVVTACTIVAQSQAQQSLGAGPIPFLPFLLGTPQLLSAPRSLSEMVRVDAWKRLKRLLKCLAVCVVVLVLAASCVDVNRYSLHGVYLNRLIRAYLGASRKESDRTPNPVTGLDPDDDNIKLADLLAGSDYYGPFLIVNTALNLVHGDELAWQERKAASFPLTPVCCGWHGPDGDHFRRTNHYGGGLKMGTAMTISGAAASPNSGYHSSTAVTILLTVFNARLGAWLGNPADDKRWRRDGPPFGLVYLFRELFGLTDARSGYVYLSDGGHFENLGGYELVRRRCRYVVLCDADQDPDHAFDDLGSLIRKCRVDLGISIELDLDALRLSAESRRCRWHCAIGRIRYDEVDTTATPGTLVYVKPSLTGDEPADVLHYAAAHPDFPHQTTANQFFNESQFESYRALGQHVAEAVFADSADEAEGRPRSRVGSKFARELFAAVARRWFAMPPDYEPSFVASTAGYVEVQRALYENADLRVLTRDLYPELFPASPQEPPEDQEAEAKRCRAEVHLVTQMLHVMENAWLSLKLDIYYAHPLNRGWMDVFHRWTNAPTVRRLWPLLRSEFSREFIRFAERQMQLGVVRAGLEDFPGNLDALARLAIELEDQWPRLSFTTENLQPPLFLRRVIEDKNYTVLAKLIYLENPYPPDEHLGAEERSRRRKDEVPAGFVTVLTAPSQGDHELFIWLRGAYRNAGLGRSALQLVLDKLRDRWKDQARTLLVRLPKSEPIGPGGELQRRMWLTFYHHLGFAQTSEKDGHVLLKMSVGEHPQPLRSGASSVPGPGPAIPDWQPPGGGI